jgi:hypothetical protein
MKGLTCFSDEKTEQAYRLSFGSGHVGGQATKSRTALTKQVTLFHIPLPRHKIFRSIGLKFAVILVIHIIQQV